MKPVCGRFRIFPQLQQTIIIIRMIVSPKTIYYWNSMFVFFLFQHRTSTIYPAHRQITILVKTLCEQIYVAATKLLITLVLDLFRLN